MKRCTQNMADHLSIEVYLISPAVEDTGPQNRVEAVLEVGRTEC